jgi:hypothetical protein
VVALLFRPKTLMHKALQPEVTRRTAIAWMLPRLLGPILNFSRSRSG